MPLLRSRSLSPDGTEIQDSNHEDWGFQGPVFSKKLAIKIVPGTRKPNVYLEKGQLLKNDVSEKSVGFLHNSKKHWQDLKHQRWWEESVLYSEKSWKNGWSLDGY